jgi:hypothetical protein
MSDFRKMLLAFAAVTTLLAGIAGANTPIAASTTAQPLSVRSDASDIAVVNSFGLDLPAFDCGAPGIAYEADGTTDMLNQDQQSALEFMIIPGDTVDVVDLGTALAEAAYIFSPERTAKKKVPAAAPPMHKWGCLEVFLPTNTSHYPAVAEPPPSAFDFRRFI